MQFLITAAMATPIDWRNGEPSEIVYIPEGIHEITPFVDGKPKKIVVRLTPENGDMVAARLQRSFEEKQKKDPIRPWFDFEHKEGVASGLPKSFRYERGKGVISQLEWTGSGKVAIQGKDYSYFSPSFHVDNDGVPLAVSNRGPLGSLVNEPAFRKIPRIAAKDATPTHIITTTTMSKIILAKLGIDPAHESAEASGVAKIEAMQSELSTVKASLAAVTTERDELKTKVEAADKKVIDLETAAKEAKTASLKAKVEAAVAAGKIAPKDEDTKKEALELLEASEALGTKFLDGLPVKFSGFDKTTVNASADGKPGEQKKDDDNITPYERVQAALAEENKAK